MTLGPGREKLEQELLRQQENMSFVVKGSELIGLRDFPTGSMQAFIGFRVCVGKNIQKGFSYKCSG